MPRRTSMYRRGGRKYGGALRLAGGGGRAKKVMDFLKKAHGFLRTHKVLSRGAAQYGKTDLPYAKQVGVAGDYTGRLGYGRRRRCCRRRR